MIFVSCCAFYCTGLPRSLFISGSFLSARRDTSVYMIGTPRLIQKPGLDLPSTFLQGGGRLFDAGVLATGLANKAGCPSTPLGFHVT